VNINFTQKEYRLLLDVVFVADWVMTAPDRGGVDENDPYQMLFQKVYSYAREAGCAELVGGDKETNRYVPTRRYEDDSGALDWIEDYNSMIFWEELIDRLAERDVLDETPAEQLRGMGEEEYRHRAEPHARRYAGELERCGIDRLVVDESRDAIE